MASAATRARAAGITSAPAPAATETHDLEKPERQLEILTPKALRYDLRFQREVVMERIENGVRTREKIIETYTRPIEIPTEFTVGQILRRDVLDDLEAFVQVALIELQHIAPSNDPRANSLAWLTTALMRSRPRMMLRELVSSIAHFADVSGDEIVRPSIVEIETGMDSADLGALGLHFVTKQLKDRAEKKAPAEG